MKDYYTVLSDILHETDIRHDRTNTGTLSSFGHKMTFNISNSFPLLTGKYTSFKLIASELLWFLSGSTNNEDLAKLCGLSDDQETIWSEWALYDGITTGDLGPIYGQQWRSWHTKRHVVLENGTVIPKKIDQIQNVIDSLKTTPTSRRHVVSAWNVADLPDEKVDPQTNVKNGYMALAPCHVMFQFYARELSVVERATKYESKDYLNMVIANEHKPDLSNYLIQLDMDNKGYPRYALSCQLYQRSADMFLGVPFNIASYSLLTYIIAHLTNMIPEKFIWVGGDCHIYKNHIDQVNELLSRDVDKYPLPTLKIKDTVQDINNITLDDLILSNYKSMPRISAPVAV